MDDIIKNELKRKMASVKAARTDRCPGEAELNDYLEGLLPKAKEEAIAAHVKSCYWCIEQLDLAQRGNDFFYQKGRGISLMTKIRTNSLKWFKENIWLLAAFIAFVISFMSKKYFFQFLILTLILGIKWIFTTGGSKTVIMIYEALRKKDAKQADEKQPSDRFTV
ncbi:MAG: hypothetical protein COS99_07280 [Candidatus Omnitrophica bacterium CG07_land_8_20_14_0_80_42_15]|uniref:Zinc-finger domain-containing protein n=1 Tax=Candidatus Aquitaenariimonas noxiae TaxID=1974741 RepID=A0A2J0KRA4_9BACT|nr:MAG: hypothetical protein COS99_07280 [Candidatus Omnitrophica bacterium CG07_land_8_20_14_0_80_42_15]